MRARGQVGLEYLVFTAFLLLMTTLLFAYAYANYSNTIQVVQTQAAIDSLASSIDFVYAKGPGNAVIIDIKLPVGLTEFRVDQNVVRATLTQYGSHTVLFALTKAPINPQYLYFQEGLYSLRVAMEDVNASVTNT
ncbi:MAG: hypothetical protein FJY86_00770 [Candidatus Diapherotrites archaeon]|uniref:Class III signal peptide-containing protein n=1 Tax=Candidatus Iainarchaeum sp. TaxID=3101447 RepID=A0A8T4CA73_9ARCH|nr:hypothetical protein [Candidatus Diapherotrites archaeon]